VVDLRNFLLNSDSSVDQIMYMTTGSFTIGAYEALDYPFVDPNPITHEHGLGVPLLPIMVWSNDADFNTSYQWYDIPSVEYQQYVAESWDNSIYVRGENQTSSPKTVYYKIFCFALSDQNDDLEVPPTANLSNNLVLDTDQNYMKLVHKGRINLTDSSPRYYHNLGYVPRILIWNGLYDINGKVSYCSSVPPLSQLVVGGSIDFTTGFKVDNEKVEWERPNTVSFVEYRIYGDS
jgi:hypothetical protein